MGCDVVVVLFPARSWTGPALRELSWRLPRTGTSIWRSVPICWSGSARGRRNPGGPRVDGRAVVCIIPGADPIRAAGRRSRSSSNARRGRGAFCWVFILFAPVAASGLTLLDSALQVRVPRAVQAASGRTQRPASSRCLKFRTHGRRRRAVAGPRWSTSTRHGTAVPFSKDCATIREIHRGGCVACAKCSLDELPPIDQCIDPGIWALIGGPRPPPSGPRLRSTRTRCAAGWRSNRD